MEKLSRVVCNVSVDLLAVLKGSSQPVVHCVSVDLLAVLKGSSQSDKIGFHLQKLMSLDGEEIVKVTFTFTLFPSTSCRHYY